MIRYGQTFLAALFLLWCSVAQALSMTAAHRTTGTAPCMVHFSPIDRNSAVRATSTITGVTFGHARNLTAAGTGSADFVAVGQTIRYTAPGDTPGTPLALTADLKAVKLYSGNGVDWIYIDVTYASLPVADQSDNITITSLRTTGVQQPTAVTDPGDPDYASQTYLWNFNDPYAITYTLTNGHNSNTCRGSPVTAHLFTRPGTYSVTLTLWTVGGTQIQYTETVTITAQEDTATVYYVDATTGSDSDDGLTPANALQTFSAAKAKDTGNDIICKFKRGGTYSVSSGWQVGHDDITITSYYNADGTDDENQARPILTSTTAFKFFSVVAGLDDVKFCNLEILGPELDGSTGIDPAKASDPPSNILVYGCKITKIHSGISSTGTTNADHGHLYHGYVDTEISTIGYGATPTNGGNGMFVELNYGAILGCKVSTILVGGEHCCRVWNNDSAVIADSTFENPADNKGALLLRGANYQAVNGLGAVWRQASAYTAILRNRIFSNTGNGPFAIAPTNESTDQRMEHYFVNGNTIAVEGVSVYSTVVRSRDTLFCNNVFITDGANIIEDAVDDGVIPRHTFNRYYNNTFISTSAGTSTAIRISGMQDETHRDPIDFFVKNNLAANIGGGTIRVWYVRWTDIAELTADYNMQDGGGDWASFFPDGGPDVARSLASAQSVLSKDANSLVGDADFTDQGGGDYTLAATSDAIDVGEDALLPWVRFDAEGALRTTNLDIGAYERGAVSPVGKLLKFNGSRIVIQDYSL